MTRELKGYLQLNGKDEPCVFGGYDFPAVFRIPQPAVRRRKYRARAQRHPLILFVIAAMQS